MTQEPHRLTPKPATTDNDKPTNSAGFGISHAPRPSHGNLVGGDGPVTQETWPVLKPVAR